MKIVFKDSFLIRLENQIDYISKDSPKLARKFKNDLLSRIKEIADNLYRYRKSI
jgi:plasmid stabilization system protein ParE